MAVQFMPVQFVPLILYAQQTETYPARYIAYRCTAVISLRATLPKVARRQDPVTRRADFGASKQRGQPAFSVTLAEKISYLIVLF